MSAPVEVPTDFDAGPKTPGRRRRARSLALLAALAVLGLLAAGFVGRATAGRSTPSDSSADAGFARDMAVHHAQAVRMAMIVRDTSQDAVLRTIAYDIALSQQEQIGRLNGWLIQWGLTPTSTRPAMAWMRGQPAAHGAAHTDTDPETGLLPDGRMPGMASRAQLDQLSDSSGRAAEVMFLRLMMAHHRGGVTMAEAGKSLAGREEVRTLAGHIATSQSAEIEAMTDLLRDRGASA